MSNGPTKTPEGIAEEEKKRLQAIAETARNLAKIGERRDNLKQKLESGGLNVDDAANLGIEYSVLKRAYKILLENAEKDSLKWT